jgi:probable HAF family extracellular repeat protein
MRVTRLLVVLIVLASTLGVGAEDKAFFLEFEPRSGALASATSATGAVVVGGFDSGGGFYWMPTTGVISVGGLGANGVSADGRTIIGTASDARGINNAAIWQRAAEWRLLGAFPNSVPCDTSLSTGTGVSRDGKVVVGFAQVDCRSAHAFRWEESTGMTDLGSTVNGTTSVAQGVSGNGKVVVGYQRRVDGTDFGVRWVDGRQESFAGPIGQVGQALATNYDGSVIVGRQCRFGLPDQTAWMWTSRDGVKCLPPPALRQSEGFVIGYANAVSDSARIVGGGLKVAASDSEAVIWIDGQPFFLKDYLRSHGVPDAFERYIVSGEITGISPDGRVLVGYGAAIGGFRGYLVILNRLEPQP